MSNASEYPSAVGELIDQLRRLPGVGRRSAERMALALIKFSAEELELFGETIKQLPSTIGSCEICGNLTERGENAPSAVRCGAMKALFAWWRISRASMP